MATLSLIALVANSLQSSVPANQACTGGHCDSLVPMLLPSFLSHTLQKTGREPGRFDHVHDDILCVVLCMVWIIELSPMHAVFESLTMLEIVALLTVIVLDVAQYDRKESLRGYNEPL